MDVYCRKCGEPWDSYGVRHGDMTPEEAIRLLRGEGCPACNFGTRCPACGGSGRERYCDGCPVCFGERVIFPWRAPQHPERRYRAWVIGYYPDIQDCPVPADEIEIIGRYETADGYIEEGRAYCPRCRERAPVCTACGGDGRLHSQGEYDELWLEGLMEGTDEDPLQYL